MFNKEIMRQMLAEQEALSINPIHRAPNKLSKNYVGTSYSDSKQGNLENFNGVAHDKYKEAILCRHLSFFVARNVSCHNRRVIAH